MRNERIERVEKLCREVLVLIAELGTMWDGHLPPEHSTSPKVRGALRRRSMDLTRALAEMRRP